MVPEIGKSYDERFMAKPYDGVEVMTTTRITFVKSAGDSAAGDDDDDQEGDVVGDNDDDYYYHHQHYYYNYYQYYYVYPENHNDLVSRRYSKLHDQKFLQHADSHSRRTPQVAGRENLQEDILKHKRLQNTKHVRIIPPKRLTKIP